ncbi:hypothetical protein PG999_006524 [Apiospora kogelbergensis]|uniref:Uncharacterized protein n=1 Tax=Apiospora kogelbergensis TaxID=1337665 RepID=A0AAW0QQT4_9PEZI
MTAPTTKSPDLREVVGPVLLSLPPAAIATQVAENILPLLTPILRQRVQLLASSSTEPWIRLLCYDPAKAARLAEIAKSDRLEAHPVSGEVEVDWDYDAETQYRRLDEETLQALVVLKDMGLSFRLVYCSGDPTSQGWKVGEVGATDTPSPFASFDGVSSIAEANRQFQESHTKKNTSAAQAPRASLQVAVDTIENDDDDDDDYWARYDATPARTPGAQRSPAPMSMPGGQNSGPTTDEDDYYAQYDSVQPAMDNHDPDEEANLQELTPPPSTLPRPIPQRQNGHGEEEIEVNETNGAWTLAEPPKSPSLNSRATDDPNLMHPRPESSASSNASVEKLEAAAENFGVQQHISRSVKSLYMLGRASGIEREDFERIVKRELELLKLMED